MPPGDRFVTYDMFRARYDSGVVASWRRDAILLLNRETLSLDSDSRKLESLRQRIPSFTCIVGCHDCCGPVTASSEEMARLPLKTEAEHDAALAELSCPHLGQHGCEVYHERPLICRLFGTTPSLLCPNGMRPVYMIDTRTEQEIHQYLASTRQVLV